MPVGSGWRGNVGAPRVPTRTNETPEAKLVKLVMFSIGATFPGQNFVWKFHADEFSPLGMPDILGVIKGRFVGLELKVEPGRFKGEQVGKIKVLHQAQALAGGVYQLKDGRVFFLNPEQVENFSLKDKDEWMPLAPKTWHDSQGKAHDIISVKPMFLHLEKQ